MLCACGKKEEEFEAPTSLRDACDLADIQANNLDDGAEGFNVRGYYDATECCYFVYFQCATAEQSYLVFNAWDDAAANARLGHAYRCVAPCFEKIDVPVLVGLFDHEGNLMFAYDEDGLIGVDK